MEEKKGEGEREQPDCGKKEQSGTEREERGRGAKERDPQKKKKGKMKGGRRRKKKGRYASSLKGKNDARDERDFEGGISERGLRRGGKGEGK